MLTKSTARPAAVAALSALILLLAGCTSSDRSASGTSAPPANDSGGPDRPTMGSSGGY
jgi:hypothetical protein